MFPSHNTCKFWNRKNETDHKESSLSLTQAEICVIGTGMKAAKGKTMGIEKSQELCSAWDLRASCTPPRDAQQGNQICTGKTSESTGMAKISWILDLLSTEIFSKLTDS